MTMDFLPVLANWSMLLKGLLLTLVLTAFALPMGVMLGIACAWARLHAGLAVRTLVASYVEVFRNTPFIIQLFFCSSACPQWACACRQRPPAFWP